MDIRSVRPSMGYRLLLSLVGGAGLAIALGLTTRRSLGTSDPATTWAILLAQTYAAIALALYVGFGRTRRGRTEVLALRRPSGKQLWLAGAVWLGSYIVAGLVYLVATAIGLPADEVVDVLLWVGADGGRLASASTGVAGLALFRICVLVPLAEELVFRGTLYSWLRSRLPAPWTIGITGFVFGLMHRLPVFIPLATLVGIGAGWIREKTGSVLPTIVLHAVQNVVVVAASLAATGWDVAWTME